MLGGLGRGFAIRGESAYVEQRRIEAGIFPVDQPEPRAVVEQIGGEHVVVAEHDIDRADRLFQSFRHPGEGRQSGDVLAVQVAQNAIVVAHHLKHPEERRRPREMLRYLAMRTLDQVDNACVIFGRLNIFRSQGPTVDEVDHQRIGVRVAHARRNAGGVSRAARRGFRHPHDIVRRDVTADAHHVAFAAILDEKVVVGQSPGERNGRHA